LASLTANAGSTVNFTAGAGTLGIGGDFAVGNSQIMVTSAPTLTNGIIGGWAVVGGTDFASYRSTVDAATGAVGIGALGLAPIAGLDTVLARPFGNYSLNTLAVGTATDNISIAASATGVTDRTINSLRINAASTVTMTPGNQLTLGTGGLLTSVGTSVITLGSLTAGSSPTRRRPSTATTTPRSRSTARSSTTPTRRSPPTPSSGPTK